MKPLDLEIIEINPIALGIFKISKIEIDLMHVNYGLDPLTKKIKTKARSNLTGLEIINLFRLLDGIIIEPTSTDDNYLYFVQDLYASWAKNWFRLVFCIEIQKPSTAGIITIYQLKQK